MSQRATLPQIVFWSLLLKGGGRVAGYCRLLSRMFCSCSPPGRFGHNVLVNVPQDNPYLFVTFYLYTNEECSVPLTVQPGRHSLENGLSYTLCSGYRQHALQGCRASLTKNRQQSTRVSAKGMDSIWSHLCFSLFRL